MTLYTESVMRRGWCNAECRLFLVTHSILQLTVTHTSTPYACFTQHIHCPSALRPSPRSCSLYTTPRPKVRSSHSLAYITTHHVSQHHSSYISSTVCSHRPPLPHTTCSIQALSKLACSSQASFSTICFSKIPTTVFCSS